MDRKKQVEEIKALNLLLEDIRVDKVIYDSNGSALDVVTVNAVEPTVTNQLANILHEKGYRLASEVAAEIFAEIEKLFFKNGVFIHIQSYNELKNKYPEDEEK